MYQDIDRLKAKDAAVQASLLYGTVRPSASERLKGLVRWAVLLLLIAGLGIFVFILPHALFLWVVITMLSSFHLAVSRLGESITFDGESGMITCRKLFRKPQTFYVSEITAIWRTCDQNGVNDARWVGHGNNMHLHVSAAHFTDHLGFEVNGRTWRVILRKSDFGKRFQGYEGGDDGVEAFDRYLRYYERSQQPDPPDEDELFDRRMQAHPHRQFHVEMPSV